MTNKRHNFINVLWQPLHWESNTASQDTFTQNFNSEFLKNSIFEENMGVMDWALPCGIM